MEKIIRFKLNGKAVEPRIDEDRMLLWLLRTEFGLTGTKYSCGEGFCGACTVIIDGEAVFSCQFPVREVEGKEVLTIEGLQGEKKLHPLQKAFVEHNALQCGYCTPGMIMQAYSLLLRSDKPSHEEIIVSMEGNLCRCGCYNRIVEAIQTAAHSIKGAGS